jgi:hypothetical protein
MEVVQCLSSRKAHSPPRVEVCEEGVSVIHAGKERPNRRGNENRGKEKGGVRSRSTEERRVERENVKERSQSAIAKDPQSAMEGKYGGRAQRKRG